MPLKEEIQIAFEKLVNAVESATDKQKASDVVAYNIGWGKCLIRWYEAGIKGEMPEMPGEGFSKWDYEGLKKHFHQKYRVDGREKQMVVFRDVVDKIIQIVDEEEENLQKLGVWEWCTLRSGKQWPLEKWIRVNTIAPFKRSASELKKAK